MPVLRPLALLPLLGFNGIVTLLDFIGFRGSASISQHLTQGDE